MLKYNTVLSVTCKPDVRDEFEKQFNRVKSQKEKITKGEFLRDIIQHYKGDDGKLKK